MATGSTRPSPGTVQADTQETGLNMHKIWSWVGGTIFWWMALGNARRNVTRYPDPRLIPPPPQAPPLTPTSPIPEPPQLPEFDDDDMVEMDEGTTYFADPLTIWFCYMPFLIGIPTILAAIPLPPFLGIPMAAGGAGGVVWALIWFIFFTRMLPPKTLGFRQFIGLTQFRDARVTIFPVWLRWLLGIRWVEVPGFYDSPITFGENGIPPLESYMHLTGNAHAIVAPPIPPPVAGSTSVGTSVIVAPPPTTPLSPSGGVTVGVPIVRDANVPVKIKAVIVVAIDIDRAGTVLGNFWDDLNGNPLPTDESMAEELSKRIIKLFLAQIAAAADETLQTIEWIYGVRAVHYVNKRLMNELPLRLSHLGIKILSIMISEIDGEPFKQLRLETDARLAADAKVNIEASRRLQELAKAEADAAIGEAEANRDRRKQVAAAAAKREAGVAQQEANLAIAQKELAAQEAQKLVADEQAKILVAPLIARLKAIGGDRANGMMNLLASMDSASLAEITKVAMTPTPGPQMLANVGGELPDIFSSPALLDKLEKIASRLGFGQTSSSPPPAPPSPPPASPPAETSP